MVQPPQHFRKMNFGGINESLFFTGRDGRFYLNSFFVNERIARIFPALIPIALFGTCFVIVEAVPVQVSILIHPLKRFDGWIHERRDQRLVSSPMPKQGKPHREKWRRGGSAVISAPGVVV